MPDLADLHRRLRAAPGSQRFTLVTRALLLVGFVAPGLTKVLGYEFAPGFDRATPAGAFFYAFYGTGGFYAFVGAAQVVAGLLLAWRRTALLGAVLFAPIIANIVVFVTATGFGLGTTLTTLGMSAACLWLLLWDAHRLAPLVAPEAAVQRRAPEPPLWDAVVPPGGRHRVPARTAFVLGTVGALLFSLAAREILPRPWLLVGGHGVNLAVLLTVGTWLAAFVRRR